MSASLRAVEHSSINTSELGLACYFSVTSFHCNSVIITFLNNIFMGH